MNQKKTIVNIGADSAWFAWFEANKQNSLDLALKRSLDHVENSGINLGKVFSACRGVFLAKGAA